MFLLGINDKDSEGIWTWDSDATPIAYENWNPGEPNNKVYGSPENCGVMLWKMWYDMKCGHDELFSLATSKVLICQLKGMYLFISSLNTLFGLLLH